MRQPQSKSLVSDLPFGCYSETGAELTEEELFANQISRIPNPMGILFFLEAGPAWPDEDSCYSIDSLTWSLGHKLFIPEGWWFLMPDSRYPLRIRNDIDT